MRISSDVRPRGAHQDSPVIKRILTEEFPAPVLECADERFAERTILAGSKCLAPLMGLRIVEKQGQAFPMTRWTIRLDLFQVGATIPDFSLGFGAFHLDPARGTAEGMLQARDVGLPRTYTEVEIVLTIPHYGCG